MQINTMPIANDYLEYLLALLHTGVSRRREGQQDYAATYSHKHYNQLQLSAGAEQTCETIGSISAFQKMAP